MEIIFVLVILTTGGFEKYDKQGGALRHVQVRHSNGSRLCTLPGLPVGRFGHTQSGLEACGGSQPKNCVTFYKGLSINNVSKLIFLTCKGSPLSTMSILPKDLFRGNTYIRGLGLSLTICCI